MTKYSCGGTGLDRRHGHAGSTWPFQGRIARMPANQRPLIDQANRSLLAELQTDARLSLAELGRRVGLSAPALAERIERLEQHGVIRGYRADVDPAAVGFPLSAGIRIRP